MFLKGVVTSLSLLALTLLTISSASAQDRQDPSELCSVIIDVIVNNQPIQYGGNNTRISGDNNNQTADITQNFDVSPTIVQECLQENEEENSDDGDSTEEDKNADEDDENDTTDDSDTDRSDNDSNEDDNNDANERDARDDVIQKTIPNKNLPNTGGASVGVFTGVGILVLFTVSLIWNNHFRGL